MGAFVGACVIATWLVSGLLCLEHGVRGAHPAFVALAFVLRSWLTTGLFITAHDAMHRTISPVRALNDALGRAACFLFAGMSYGRLVQNHHRHHAAPATGDDPDFTVGAGYLRWLATFFARYTTVWQIVTMAALYNLLHLRWDDASLWLYWAGPAIVASLQLFTFGTYLPHRTPHDESLGPHRARTLPKGHVWAMLSCWFFGYHREHHESPGTPWWRLWRAKA